MTSLRRCSKSPLYFVPASKVPISREYSSQLLKRSGTSFSLICMARPSAIAVFPTPGSPTRIGLFFLLRQRICISLSISSVLPMSGSIFLSCAFFNRSLVNSSKGSFFFDFFPCLSVCFKPFFKGFEIAFVFFSTGAV